MFLAQEKFLSICSPLNPNLDSWLTHRQSLTKKLRELSGAARLHVVNQSWAQSNWWDHFALGLTFVPIMRRDIIMYSMYTPCWFARTIIPQTTYNNHLELFSRLAKEPLGELIFPNPQIQRENLIHYSINKKCLEYYWLPQFLQNSTTSYWVRLSTFSISNLPFYLIEILLPGLTELILS